MAESHASKLDSRHQTAASQMGQRSTGDKVWNPKGRMSTTHGLPVKAVKCFESKGGKK